MHVPTTIRPPLRHDSCTDITQRAWISIPILRYKRSCPKKGQKAVESDRSCSTILISHFSTSTISCPISCSLAHYYPRIKPSSELHFSPYLVRSSNLTTDRMAEGNVASIVPIGHYHYKSISCCHFRGEVKIYPIQASKCNARRSSRSKKALIQKDYLEDYTSPPRKSTHSTPSRIPSPYSSYRTTYTGLLPTSVHRSYSSLQEISDDSL